MAFSYNWRFYAVVTHLSKRTRRITPLKTSNKVSKTPYASKAKVHHDRTCSSVQVIRTSFGHLPHEPHLCHSLAFLVLFRHIRYLKCYFPSQLKMSSQLVSEPSRSLVRILHGGKLCFSLSALSESLRMRV